MLPGDNGEWFLNLNDTRVEWITLWFFNTLSDNAYYSTDPTSLMRFIIQQTTHFPSVI